MIEIRIQCGDRRQLDERLTLAALCSDDVAGSDEFVLQIFGFIACWCCVEWGNIRAILAAKIIIRQIFGQIFACELRIR